MEWHVVDHTYNRMPFCSDLPDLSCLVIEVKGLTIPARCSYTCSSVGITYRDAYEHMVECTKMSLWRVLLVEHQTIEARMPSEFHVCFEVYLFKHEHTHLLPFPHAASNGEGQCRRM